MAHGRKHLYQWTAIDECTRICFIYGFEEHTPENTVKFFKMLQKVFLKLSITLDTFPTRIMKRSVRRQPLRRIFAVLQLVEYHQSPSRSCGCSSNSWNTARPWISALPFCNVLSFCPGDKTILLSSLPRCFHISHDHVIMASSSRTVHALHNAIFFNDCPICSTGILAAAVGMHNGFFLRFR